MRDIMIFSTGLILGAAAGAFGMWGYMKKNIEQTSTELKNYHEKIDEYLQNNLNEKASQDDEDRENGILNPANRADMKARANLVRRNKEVVAYNSMYEKTIENNKDMSSWVTTTEVEEEDDVNEPLEEEAEDDEIDPEEDPGADYHAHEHLPTRAISYSEMSSLPSHVDRQTFYLYNNGTITDEDKNVVYDSSPLFGDVLDEEGFYDDDSETVIFIMNYNLDVCYEVEKVNADFE